VRIEAIEKDGLNPGEIGNASLLGKLGGHVCLALSVLL